MDRGVWQATVHGVAKESDATEQLNNNNRRYVGNLRSAKRKRNTKRIGVIYYKTNEGRTNKFTIDSTRNLQDS